MVRKIITDCCALSQISCGNYTPIKAIKDILKLAQTQAKLDWFPSPHGNGERAFFVITTPNEILLEEKLTQLGFKLKFTFPRRNGYPQGMLKYWLYVIQ